MIGEMLPYTHRTILTLCPVINPQTCTIYSLASLLAHHFTLHLYSEITGSVAGKVLRNSDNQAKLASLASLMTGAYTFSKFAFLPIASEVRNVEDDWQEDGWESSAVLVCLDNASLG